MLSEIPTPAAGSTEAWLWSFAAVLSIALLAKKLFVRTPSVENEFATKTELKGVESKIEERLDLLDLKRSRQVAALHEDIRETERSLGAQIKVVAENTAFIRGKIEGN